MTAAIEYLKSELGEQTEKLAAITEETRADIEKGAAAQRRLFAQRDHVNELIEAAGVLERNEKAKQEPA